MNFIEGFVPLGTDTHSANQRCKKSVIIQRFVYRHKTWRKNQRKKKTNDASCGWFRGGARVSQMTEQLHVGGHTWTKAKTKPIHFGESAVLFIQPHLWQFRIAGRRVVMVYQVRKCWGRYDDHTKKEGGTTLRAILFCGEKKI